MIKYFDGTVFNANTQAIVNTVNCVGVMGAGIALEFKLRYPEMFDDYEKKCKEKQIRTGFVDYYNSDSQLIINFPTKWHFKYPSKLIWIEQGLKDFAKTYKKHGIESVAFPKLGANKGGLNWEDVKIIMEKYLSDLDIKVIICLDETKVAEGVEKMMLDKFNSIDIMQLVEIIRLSQKQKENILRSVPYNRFWKIGETESIGSITYSKIFKYFYDLSTYTVEEPKQMLLFE